MNPFRRFFRRFRNPVGFPLGVHVPADPADHAEDFAHHKAALKMAPKTELPINDRARRILVEMQKGWRERSARGQTPDHVDES
jgi:hypothetical protein